MSAIWRHLFVWRRLHKLWRAASHTQESSQINYNARKHAISSNCPVQSTIDLNCNDFIIFRLLTLARWMIKCLLWLHSGKEQNFHGKLECAPIRLRNAKAIHGNFASAACTLERKGNCNELDIDTNQHFTFRNGSASARRALSSYDWIWDWMKLVIEPKSQNVER